MLTLYGLKNCDTCRAARKWLDGAGISYRYHDVRSDGLDDNTISAWLAATNWETLVNKRSQTWRKIPDAERSALDESRAAALMLEYPTLAKRPVLIGDGRMIVGFSEDRYAELEHPA